MESVKIEGESPMKEATALSPQYVSSGSSESDNGSEIERMETDPNDQSHLGQAHSSLRHILLPTTSKRPIDGLDLSNYTHNKQPKSEFLYARCKLLIRNKSDHLNGLPFSYTYQKGGYRSHHIILTTYYSF